MEGTPPPDALRAPPAVTHGWLCIYCSGERDQSGAMRAVGALLLVWL